MSDVGDDVRTPEGAILERVGAGWVLRMRNLLGAYDADVETYTEDRENAIRLLGFFLEAYRLGWEHRKDFDARKGK